MKKSKKILLSFMTGAMLFSVLPNVASAHSNPLSVDEGEKKEISNEIEQLLESRAAIMVSDGQVLHESQFTSKAADIKEEEQRNQIAQFRDELKEVGETYSSTRTDRRSLNQVLQDWKGGTFYAYRT